MRQLFTSFIDISSLLSKQTCKYLLERSPVTALCHLSEPAVGKMLFAFYTVFTENMALADTISHNGLCQS